ncbi:enoyl-CoA hydratase/carnithine racemase [Natronospira proteinivora]|uniref:Enoyl-CoA hydratase/carnithine racemase n=1 Tax=Natronospira proteinivora TaxID=1807133 RepID=A0ABT1G5S0_9GAMM|nr:enoyl-CoA hydratase/isomerase family protein [Natronospira proteinivora]MCP1726644.1 enoyl-CoA hydratase/carnithine racemase [Natronospira proteinivora]
MIESHEHGDVVELRLNRPPVNALNPDLIQALDQKLADAVAQGARAVVLSGGEKMFSAGLDVPMLLRLSRDEITTFWGDFFGLMRRLAECPVPVSAAITGHSPAGGAVLAIFCDQRVMSRGEFRIGLNEVQVGLPVPDVICHGLKRLVGGGTANRLLTAGELILPEEALRIGFVDALADDPGATRQSALDWATHVAAQPPVAVAATRRVARADLVDLFGAVDRETCEAMSDVWFSSETQGAMHALVERLASK